MSELANAIESERKTLSITTKTYKRLQSVGHWSESADELINRLIDERQSKENVSGGSF